MPEKKKKIKDFKKHSQYFVLYEDASRIDLETLDDYDLEAVPVADLWTGEKYKRDLSRLTLKLTRGRLADTLGNPLSWPIYSNRCLKLLWPLIGQDVQPIPLNVKLANGTVDVKRYTLVNPIGTVDAIHSPKKKKGEVSLVELVLDTKKIPLKRHIFRLKHNETTIIASADVVQALSDNGMQGFSASPLDLI